MDQQKKKKVIITVFAGIALLLVYMMIFSFSADTASESSVLSEGITNWFLELCNRFTGGGQAEAESIQSAEDSLLVEGVVRKMAHFGEYMLLGLLSFIIAVLWIEKMKVSVRIVAIQLVISASLDELHQYFVPGRYASVRDVMIDTAGGIAGILLIFLMKGLKKKWNRTPRQK